MPKIKLIKIHQLAGYHSDYSDFSDSHAVESLSDWEEVTEEELNTLKSFQSYEILNKDGVKVVVYEEITNRKVIQDYIHDIKGLVEKRKKETQKRLAEELKKKEETAKRREATKIARAKKLLEEKGLL